MAEEERLTTAEYRPQKFVENYVYPYPTNELIQARSTLIRSVVDWSRKPSTEKLKEKLGIPGRIDNLVLQDLESRTPNFVPNRNIPSVKTFDPIMDITQAPGPSPSPSTSIGGGQKRKSDLIVLCEEKRPRAEPEKISPIKVVQAGASSLNTHRASISTSPVRLNNLVSVNIQDNSTSVKHVEKGGISPVRVVEAGSSLLSVSSVLKGEEDNSTEGTPSNLRHVTTSSRVEASQSSSSKMTTSASVGSAVTGSANSPELVTEGSENKEKSDLLLNKADGSLEKKKTTVVPVLKCDYCDQREHETYHTKMLSHLKTANHYSASIYNCCKTGDNLNVVSVQKRLAVTNPDAKMHSIFVACPQCPTIFGDIFQCGMHSRYAHIQSNEQYCLVPVKKTHVVVFTRKNILSCKVCTQKFPSLRELNKHEKRHSHFPHKVDCERHVVFLMSCCRKFTIDSYFSAKLHVETEFVKNKSSNTRSRSYLPEVTMTMKVLDMSAKEKKDLPPPQIQDAVKIIKNDIMIFKDYLNFQKHSIGNSLKANKLELKRLQLMKADLDKGQEPLGHFPKPTPLLS